MDDITYKRELAKKLAKDFNLNLRDSSECIVLQNADIIIRIHLCDKRFGENIIDKLILDMDHCFDKWSKSFYDCDVYNETKIIKDISFILQNVKEFNEISNSYCVYYESDGCFKEWFNEALKEINY